MEFRKWLMKQQWRIVQVRGIWSLFYGILLLAAAYYAYLPYIQDLGELGPFVFTGILLLTFAIMGYIYDRVFVLWAPSHEVTQERNPFQYVARPIDRIFWLPMYSAVLDSCEQLANHFGIEPDVVVETREYYAEYEKLRPERKDDIDAAIVLRDEYVKKHSFSDIVSDKE